MWGKFEWQFKQRDESPVNAAGGAAGGKFALSSEVSDFPSFRAGGEI